MAVPKLRFKEFNTGYISTTFEKLKGFSIQSGKSEDKGDTGEFPFYGSTGVIGHKNVFDYEGKSILIARVGANAGSLYQIDGKYSVSDNTLRLTVSDNISLDYLRGLLIKFNLNRLVFGTGQPLVTGGMIKKVNIFIPEFIEQNKIASFLSSVDEKISQLTQKHQLLSLYKQGMMQKLFSQQIRFKADDGSEFEEWKKTEIKNISKIFDGTHQTPNYVTAGVPFYSVEHVTANNFKNTKYIAEDVYLAELKRVQLEKGDILLTRIGDIGTCKLIDWDVRASFYVSLALIKVNKQHSSSFVNQYIKSNLFQKELHERTIHVAFPKKINLGEIGLCLIQLPCLEEQTKIANFLSAIDQKINVVSGQIEQAKLWKKGLLQQMFV